MSKYGKSKGERLISLKIKLNEVLPAHMLVEALILLDQFEKGFEIIRYHNQSEGIEKLWYKIIGFLLFIDGILRDVRLNSGLGDCKLCRKYFFGVGQYLFGDFSKFGTLTATLIRVKESKLTHDGRYFHMAYGYISVERYELACQICEVLSDYEKGHC